MKEKLRNSIKKSIVTTLIYIFRLMENIIHRNNTRDVCEDINRIIIKNILKKYETEKQ